MALQLDIKIEINGVNDQVIHKNGYAVISRITGRKNFYVHVYFLTEKDGVTIKSKIYPFTPDLEGENYHSQAYTYLKSLPDFAGSYDV